MNKSILRKSSQIISNHVMYGRAKTWTCQSLAKDVCKEQMPRCKFQSEVSVKAFLQKLTEQMHPEVGVYLQMEDWNDDGAHPNYVEMSTRRTLRFILQVLNYACIYMVQLYLTSFSPIQTQGRCPPFFPFHMVLAGGSWPGAPHHRCHPETPGGGPAPPSSCRARSAPRCESSAHASVHEQPGCPPVEAGEAG